MSRREEQVWRIVGVAAIAVGIMVALALSIAQAHLCRTDKMIMTLQRDDEGTPDGKIKKPQAEDLWKEVRVDGLVYRVQSISPETPDRWRTAIRPLVLFPIAIFAVAALVGIFGAPLREWAMATPVFRPFLASEMPLAPPAVRIPANSK